MGRPKTIADAEILDVARRVFIQKGHVASTRDVAQEAGISQAVLYQRFRTKDELFFAAMLPPAPDVDALVGAPGANESPEAWLSAAALRLLDYFEAIVPVLLHLVTHPSFHVEGLAKAHDHFPASELAQAFARQLEALKGVGRIGAVDAGATAETLVAAIHSFAIFRGLTGGKPTPKVRARVVAMVKVLWEGLRPDVTSRRRRA